MSDSQIIRAFAGKLIEKLGGFDATAALLSARFGKEVHKGTISKRQAGDLEWPLSHIWVMEDATGDHCISRYRLQSLPDVEEALCLMQAAGELAVEGGEAVQAMTMLAMGKGCRVEARKQISDVISTAKRTASMLERGEDE